MKKLLTIAVPCYNSESYMRTCLDSLIIGGKAVEVLIVDDGSFKDNTAAVADEYAAAYPDICRVIHQPNGGHGAAINTAIANARGEFFKVVDSDDKLDKEAYKKVLACLKKYSKNPERPLDMLVTNYVYDKQGARHKQVISYGTAFPKRRLFGWKNLRFFMLGQYLLMHAVIYRTAILRKCGMKLPEHTFYVDNMYVFEPLPFVKTIYYLDEKFYLYYIGREDQSVNESVMIGRLDQQYRVTRLMLEYFRNINVKERKLRSYMIRYLDIMMTICSILAIRSGTEENLRMKDELWRELKESSPALYRRLRHTLMGTVVNLPGKAGRRTAILCYKLSQKIFGFN